MTDGSQPLPDNQHERFAQKLAFGDCSITEAYTRAGYIGDGKKASRAAKNGEIIARVEWLKKQTEKANVLSAIEKREFCALAVRTPIGEINERHVLCQSLKRRRIVKPGVEIDTEDGGIRNAGEEWEVEEIKAVDKLKSIEVDNVMAGHNKPSEVTVTGEVTLSLVDAVKAITHGPAKR